MQTTPKTYAALSKSSSSMVKNTLLHKALSLTRLGVRGLDLLQPAAALGARLYVAQAFFASGLTKLRDWDTTLALFQDEYMVPFLRHDVAAVLGTGGELVLPVMLALGLGGRFAALGLSVVNVVAVVSLAEIAPAALQQHQFWGALLIGVAVFGPGRWALDHWVQRLLPVGRK
jgi:putative oxidoreductase